MKLIRERKKAVMLRRCTDCRHEWAGRQAALPKKCPRCQSHTWNDAKREAVTR